MFLLVIWLENHSCELFLKNIGILILVMMWQSEMKAEMYNFARERKELSEQIQEVESQLEWLRLERDDEIKKLGAEKKALQDRLHDAEAQISQLKSRNREELKVLCYILCFLAFTPLWLLLWSRYLAI